MKQIQSQVLRCTEPGCQRDVIYEPRPVFSDEKHPYQPKGRIRVYLVCDAGHSRDYVVWPYVKR